MISAVRFAAGDWHIDDQLRLLRDQRKRQLHADDIEKSFKAHASEIPDGMVLEYAPYKNADDANPRYGIVIGEPVQTKDGVEIRPLDIIERPLGSQTEHPMGFQPNRPPMSAETLVTQAIARAREISDTMNAQANELLAKLRDKGIPGLGGLGNLADLFSRGPSEGENPFGGLGGADGKDGDDVDPSEGSPS